MVADLIVGTELFCYKGFRFGFSIITRIPEFRKQRGVDTFLRLRASLLTTEGDLTRRDAFLGSSRLCSQAVARGIARYALV